MASSSARAIHTVKQHVPLIRFPKRGSQPNYAATGQSAQQGARESVQRSAPTAPSESPRVGTTPRGSGIDERLLPAYFKRPLLTSDEIEAINVGLIGAASAPSRMGEEDAGGELVHECKTLCRLVKEGEDIVAMRRTASSMVQSCSENPNGEDVLTLWKELEERSTNLLQDLLGAIEKCDDTHVVVSVTQFLDTFVHHSPKGHKKRIRLVASLNGVTSIMKCFLTFYHQSPINLETIEPLISLILLFGTVDKKFHLKVRLSGALKAATELCKPQVPTSLSVLDLLIAAAQSAPNAIFIGKSKDMIPFLFDVTHSSRRKDNELCRRSLELMYYLAKTRKNRLKLISENGIKSMVDLFQCYFPPDEDECSMKMCLISLGTLRLLTRSKSSQQTLLDCNGLELFRDAIKTCLKRYQQKHDGSGAWKELDAAVCAACLRCLPMEPLPDDVRDHPVQFPLPVDDDRRLPEEKSDSEEGNNEAGASEADEENSEYPFKDREQRDPADLESEYGKYAKEFHTRGSGSSRRPFRSIDRHASSSELLWKGSISTSSSSSTIRPETINIPNRYSSEKDASWFPRRRSLSLDDAYGRRNAQSNGTFSRLRVKIEATTKLPPISAALRRMSLEDPPRWKKMKPLEYTPDEYVKQAAATKSVTQFSKIAYPELHGAYPNLPLQPLKDTSTALLERVLQEIENAISPSSYQERTVFDLATALKDKCGAERLTNDDTQRIGKPDPTCDHLKFESRFESGNLRKVMQVGPHEYELFLTSDINQIQQHYQWFYFEVSNMQPDVPYTFTVVNCIKSQSLFQTGMQPVVFSVSEAVSGRPGWARCGRTVAYYKNRYIRQGKKINETRSYYSASFTVAFRHAYDVCYFAYHYPYTYSMMKTHLSKMQESLSNRRDVYFRRDTLCTTLGGNRVDLITITGTAGQNVMAKRDCIVLTARVHPGEANSSWMMHGVIGFLLSDSAKAKEARGKYVFKLIPMLNPDGVINGNHRCSLVGQDLNRQWVKPSRVLHPTIYHVKGLLQYLSTIGKSAFVYCDFHGHSRKKNIFLYGNNPQLSWWTPDHALSHQYEFYSLPEILDEMAPGFWLKGSSFVIQKDKEASARVAVWRELNVGRSYTLEATYGGFDRGQYQGYQIGTHQCMEMGRNFCEALVTLKDQVDSKQLPSRKFEESDEDNVPFPASTGEPFKITSMR